MRSEEERKEAMRGATKRWRIRNADRFKETCRLRRMRNKEDLASKRVEYRRRNTDRINSYQRTWWKASGKAQGYKDRMWIRALRARHGITDPALIEMLQLVRQFKAWTKEAKGISREAG